MQNPGRIHITKRQLPSIVAFCCAVVMLFILPAVFRNALFDINQVKVDIVLAAAPLFALFMVAALACSRSLPSFIKETRRLSIPLVLFAAAAVISSARLGFSQETVLGTDGRSCGLAFLLSCIAVYFIIVIGALPGKAILLLSAVTAAAVAVLGVLNAAGVDPFDFYIRMQKGQEHLFLSTIGNIDFFGCFLALMLPIASGGWIRSGNKAVSRLYFACSLCIMAGIAASRCDSALLSVQIGMLALLSLSGDNHLHMAKVLFLWALSFSVLPLIYHIMQSSRFFVPFTGVCLVLLNKSVALSLCFVLFSASAMLFLFHLKGKKAPGTRKVSAAVLAVIILLTALFLFTSVYFTVFQPEAEIGERSSVFRFDDHWGTRRGFVYRCTLRAFEGFSAADRLFGGGVGMTGHILEPYFDQPAMLAYGTFNDAHCQPLQFLLTTGLVGAFAVLLFHIRLLVSLFRYGRRDSLLFGLCAAMCAYVPVALLNVAQPILLISYLSAAAAAVSRIQFLNAKEGVHES